MICGHIKKKEISSIDQLPSESFGFIYKIINKNNNKAYIGKKFLYNNIRKKINGKIKKIKKESDWKLYFGSNQNLKKDVKDGHIIEKEILKICYGKKQLTYYELKYLFSNSVLEDEKYYNDNISGKFFRRDV